MSTRTVVILTEAEKATRARKRAGRIYGAWVNKKGVAGIFGVCPWCHKYQPHKTRRGINRCRRRHSQRS